MDTCLATSPRSFTPAQVLPELTVPAVLCPPVGHPAPPALKSSAGQTPLPGTLWGPSVLLPPCGRPSLLASASGPPGRVTELSATWDLDAWILTAGPRGYNPPAAVGFTSPSAGRPAVPSLCCCEWLVSGTGLCSRSHRREDGGVSRRPRCPRA